MNQQYKMIDGVYFEKGTFIICMFADRSEFQINIPMSGTAMDAI